MRKSPENRRALPFDQWPERDRRAWIAATTENDDDLLVVDRPASTGGPSSIELFVRYYGIWLAWMKTEGLARTWVCARRRVTPERLTAYLKAQPARECRAKTLVNNAVSLRHMFEALAPDTGLDLAAAD